MRFSIFTIDPQYLAYVHEADPHVQLTASKSSHPDAGIVLPVHGMDYFIPMICPKPKHAAMKNQVDFYKMDGGTLGALNLNNMIPVPASCLRLVDLSLTGSKEEINYRNLLRSQLTWCNKHREQIATKAEKLYALITSHSARGKLADHCVDYSLLEDKCRQWS